ncbi:hypothetical protein PVK06_029044 [Gossypium arboreum]|uniref:Uncharacterized protein n=1 Tax=Gossypium arboreum TaxID=29729 RepID=A0ABR0P5K6_GOSAR|nr:hypothetical protein PVK06_029044 [Gossypium arboreum]
MAVDSDPPLSATTSWKDKLIGTGSSGTSQEAAGIVEGNDGDFILLDDDIIRTTINGIPAIDFSDWIRLPGLPGFMYKRKILEAIGSMIGKVVKLDFKTDNKTRGRFARMALFINLDKPFISQICVNGEIQRVEYDDLPTVCFTCGKYEHVRELCSMLKKIRAKMVTKWWQMAALAATTAVLGRTLNQLSNLRCWWSVDPSKDRGNIKILAVHPSGENIIASSSIMSPGDTGLQAVGSVEKQDRPLSFSKVVSDQQAPPTCSNAENSQALQEIRIERVMRNLALPGEDGKNSNVLKECRSRFKASANSRVSLADSMKEVAKLISSDLSNEAETEMHTESDTSGLNDSRQ